MIHIGNRVKCVKSVYDSDTVLGFEGTVRVINKWGNRPIGVEWDQVFNLGHDLAGALDEEGHGWWVSEDSIELIPKLTEDENDDETKIDEDAFTEILNIT